MVKELYLQTLTELAKATGDKVPRKFVAAINAAHDKTEPKVQAYLLSFFKKYRTSLKRRLSKTLAKSTEDQVKAAVEAAIGSAVLDDFPDLFNDLVRDITDNIASLGVTPDWQLVNTKVTAYLRSQAQNYFKDFSDNEARGIQSAIADAMESKDGYTIKTIVANILSNPVVYTKSRKLDPTDWATMVARTETAKAASFAQRSNLEDIGARTWQWAVQASGCDDCQENDDEIVVMGDPFPSGDTESPAHQRCRCVCLPVLSELTTLQTDDNP